MARLAARLIATLGVALIGLSAPALAGDRAEISLLGFSGDGRYFAFEEYGIQDGSGFPFSRIFALDVQADKWVAGAPFAARIETDGASLADARSKAMALAKGPLGELNLSEPASFIALNGDGEPFDGKSLSVGDPGYGLEPARNMGDLILATFPLTATEDCAAYMQTPTVGFDLSIGGVTLHRDTAIPKSRGCPMDYRIYGVAAAPGLGDTAARVAIISVYSYGFEGPDRRFIAVPLPDQ